MEGIGMKWKKIKEMAREWKGWEGIGREWKGKPIYHIVISLIPLSFLLPLVEKLQQQLQVSFVWDEMIWLKD